MNLPSTIDLIIIWIKEHYPDSNVFGRPLGSGLQIFSCIDHNRFEGNDTCPHKVGQEHATRCVAEIIISSNGEHFLYAASDSELSISNNQEVGHTQSWYTLGIAKPADPKYFDMLRKTIDRGLYNVAKCDNTIPILKPLPTY